MIGGLVVLTVVLASGVATLVARWRGGVTTGQAGVLLELIAAWLLLPILRQEVGSALHALADIFGGYENKRHWSYRAYLQWNRIFNQTWPRAADDRYAKLVLSVSWTLTVVALVVFYVIGMALQYPTAT